MHLNPVSIWRFNFKDFTDDDKLSRDDIEKLIDLLIDDGSGTSKLSRDELKSLVEKVYIF